MPNGPYEGSHPLYPSFGSMYKAMRELLVSYSPKHISPYVSFGLFISDRFHRYHLT
jgi:hypothetical protein